LSSFAVLGVPEPLSAALARRGIHEPFPIQAATLPDALAGRDVAGKAPTGSGKTLAFGLAVAAMALDGRRPKPRRPRALVLVPTRELAAQVQRELQQLLPRDAGPVAAVYGGVGYGPQRSALARGASCVVACPGRLEDLIASGDVVLDRVEVAVVDEADRMADMGFLPAVKRILDTTPDRRQTLLFSATLDGDVDALVRRYQHDPVQHEVAGSEDDTGEVRHLFWRVPRTGRPAVAAQVVDRAGPTIVFCRTTHGADRVARQLAKEGVKAAAIHGRRTQGQRNSALAAFTAGKAWALVATDVAARGIHVDGVAAVVHFDLPEDPKDFVHRSGRTGRAGADGLVVSLVSEEDGDRKARQLQRGVGLSVPLTEPDLDLVGGVPAGTTVAAAASAAGSDDVDEVDEVDERSDTPVVTAGSAAPAGRGARRRSRPRRERTEYGGERERVRHPRPERREQDTRTARDGRRRRNANGSSSAQGTVKSFRADKGYGFITRPDGGDVFVHASNAGGRHLAPGQRVHFEVAPGRRGHQAVNVRPA
jgi:superfamily II DNA/RNA helicase